VIAWHGDRWDALGACGDHVRRSFDENHVVRSLGGGVGDEPKPSARSGEHFRPVDRVRSVAQHAAETVAPCSDWDRDSSAVDAEPELAHGVVVPSALVGQLAD